ncbi:MAG: DNA topoisomerase IV subunit B [Maricaulaceae bacterium]
MAARKTTPLEDAAKAASSAYTARDIEVLEGLEPVRRRPGMYIGGADERALHHLFAEVLDNAMDEAIAGHADKIDVELDEEGYVTVTDNGRGIPVDNHPKFKNTSALEVILTTLHSGGKFSDKAYQTSGGLHGVGVSVVNALSEDLVVEVARDRQLYRQTYSRGRPTSKLENVGKAPNRRGTVIRFKPDPEIFGPKAAFRPARVFAMARSKAYLRRGVTIRWRCPEELIEGSETPAEAVLHFPGGLADFLAETMGSRATITAEAFTGRTEVTNGHGGVEWAIAWTPAGFGETDGFVRSYCNTVPTPDGGTHEQGLRAALTRGLRAYGELKNDKKASNITAEDLISGAGAMISVFIHDPEFQGQTKERLATAEAARIVESAVRDHFDHWLAAAPKEADKLLAYVVERAEARMKRRREREVARKSATKKLRLPGKLADCSNADAAGSELFLVEGDSAGGSAKQARNRATQAVLPLRGKILNVASAGSDKISANQELSDLALALGCGLGARFSLDDLRYERIIIMTDADVDGAHIAALLITFFLRSTPGLAESGRLYLATPPLYRISKGAKIAYARDEAHKNEILQSPDFSSGGKIEVSRFKGLGEMMPAQLKETTMNPESRTLARVQVDPTRAEDIESLVETLMGRKAELRYAYIQDHARFVDDVDV